MATTLQRAKSTPLQQEGAGDDGPNVLGTFQPTQAGIQPTAGNDYVIYLTLMVPGVELFQGRATSASGQWGNPFPMPAVRQNCTSNCDDCFDHGGFTGIYLTQCTDRPFKVELVFRKIGTTVPYGKAQFDIVPQCGYGGAVLCVT